MMVGFFAAQRYDGNNIFVSSLFLQQGVFIAFCNLFL